MSNPLFKAKTLKGNWVFGYYYEDNGKAYILDNGKAYEVQKETRCQYLGKIDDKEIYEHDIISGIDLDTIETGEVVWDDELYRYVLETNSRYYAMLFNLVDIKILGNKFDK